MMIEFTGKIKNYTDGLYINTARFQLPSGKVINVDRDRTEYDVNEDNLAMLWRGCYGWDDDGSDYELPADFHSAKLVSLEIEDDAPDGFDVMIFEYDICD